jgi:T-complex protein 1 subunit zeta
MAGCGGLCEHVSCGCRASWAPGPSAAAVRVQGPADHTLAQIKEAIRDGLRAVKNTLDDGAVVPGAGAFEVAAAHHLRTATKKV